MSKFSEIPDRTFFKTSDGSSYQKIDGLYYLDPLSGFESAWSPIFDKSIITATEKPTEASPSDNKYITDPQSRLTVANPTYRENPAVEWFAELWGSGAFDCGPEDYEFMSKTSLAAVETLNRIALLLEGPMFYAPAAYPAIEELVTALLTPPSPPVVKAKKAVAKKAPVKAVAKKVVKKSTPTKKAVKKTGRAK